MASPDSTMKTVTQKKPVIIKKGQIFIPQYPIVLKTRLKRSITNAVATPVESSAKRTCLTESNALQSSVETPIINHTGSEQTPVSNTNVIDKEEEKKETDTKPYNARALIRCEKHGSIPEYSAEGLVEIGFTYDSIEAFQEYATMHSKKWYFYYKRSDSRNIKTSPHYNPARPTYLLYSCRFDRKYQKSKSRGIRKRTSGGSVICPAGVTLKCKPGEDTYRVQTVCHHHTHELSAELFRKTPHGYRLPQEIKDEISDLALFNIDPAVAHRYIMTKIPDLDLKTTVYNTFRKIRSKNDKAEMSPQKITEMIAKIKYIKANFSSTGPHNKKQPVDASKSQEKHLKKNSKSQQNNEAATETDTDDFQDNIIKTTRTYNNRTPSREIQQSFPINVKSESDAIQSAENIADTTIQTAPTEDETAASNLILRRVESEEDFNPSSQLMNELSELESTIADQHEMQGTDENTFLMNLPCDRTQLRCQRKHDELPEHHAEGLVMEGDTFSSLEEFADYAADHALKWFFYYQISDSRNIKTSKRYNNQLKSLYTFSCRFDKRRYKTQSTGVRKVKPKATQCPATISMVCRPGEEDFTVTYACHHHSHELSEETFRQEAHGHRLSPELKSEIRELVWFQLEPWLIRQYVLQKTGLDLKRTIINLLSKLKNGRMKLNISSKRKKEILGKIEEIKKNFSNPKRTHRHKKQSKREQDKKAEHSVSDGEERNGSRVEARLNNILHDQGLIQSIKELQQETGCEIQINSEPEMNHIAGISHLQTGLIEENYNNDNKIENDQEQYTVNENFHYTTSVVDGTEFGEDNNLQPGDNIVYLQIESIHEQNVYEVEIDSSGNQCDENIENIEFKVPCADQPAEEDMVSYSEEIGYKEDVAETNIQDYEADQYQLSHTNDTDGITTYDEENIAQCDENVNYLEEITETTQQDFENVEHQDYNDDTDGSNNYEEECENIKQLELSMMNEQSNENTISVSTRGRPKVVLEERIINRYNIELYINVGGVIPCLENMAINMNVSVLELLKRLYNGEAVFKMSSGRSGKQDRKTVQLQYVPLAIAFPFDKFNYMNTLREYKKMCSNYSNMAMSLENTVESISEDLKAANEKIEMVESQNEELSNVKKCYEGLLQSHIITTQLLKQSQLDLEEAQSKNWFLSERINKLEDLLQEYQIEDYEIPNQRSRVERTNEDEEDANKYLIDRTLKCQQSSKLCNTVSSDKLKTLEEKSLTNIKIIEKIKSLEDTVKVSDADIKLYREKIVKLEDLYLADNQSLLGKIKRLEEEISSLKNKLNLSEISKKSLLSQINSSELVITKLRKQIHSLEDLNKNEKKKVY